MTIGSKNTDLAVKAKSNVNMMVSELMPQGVPRYREVIKRTPVFMMLQSAGEDMNVKKELHTVLFMLIKDFCNSLNLVRPMDDFQMVDAASFLLDECADFRIEDYAIMFNMAKRGKLIKILDRMDIQLIGTLVNSYWAMRDVQIQHIEEVEHRKRKNEQFFIPKPKTPDEIEASERFGKLVDLLKEAPGHEQEGLGTSTKKHLEKSGFDNDERMKSLKSLSEKQKKLLEQTQYYKVGLPVSWVKFDFMKNRTTTCEGKIVSMRGDGMKLEGTDEQGNQVTDYLSIKDTTIKIKL